MRSQNWRPSRAADPRTRRDGASTRGGCECKAKTDACAESSRTSRRQHAVQEGLDPQEGLESNTDLVPCLSVQDSQKWNTLILRHYILHTCSFDHIHVPIMTPATPTRGHKRGTSSISISTSEGFVSAQEETPTRPESADQPSLSPSAQGTIKGKQRSNLVLEGDIEEDDDQTPLPTRIDLVNRALVHHSDDEVDEDELDGHKHFDLTSKLQLSGHRAESETSGASGSGVSSFNSDSMLEILDNEDEPDHLDMDEEELGEEGVEGDPLVANGRRRRRRKRWDESDEKSDRSLFEVSKAARSLNPTS